MKTLKVHLLGAAAVLVAAIAIAGGIIASGDGAAARPATLAQGNAHAATMSIPF